MPEAGAAQRIPHSGWQMLAAKARGAVHEATGRPIQDAVACFGDPGRPQDVLALAVADGHGHPRHGRSAAGAALAVHTAGPVLVEHGSLLAGASTSEEVCAALRSAVIPAIVDGWAQAVARDSAEHPLQAGEEAWLRPGEDAAIAYGTTLLLAAVSHPWLALCQIGDGDIVVVDSGGLAEAPVPGDDRLDGRRTTSLCQADAESSFRCAALNLASRDVAAVLLATDGFGNAQPNASWRQVVGADLVNFAREHGVGRMRDRLPDWLARCASAQGSGDDAALAMLLRHEPERASLVCSAAGCLPQAGNAAPAPA